MRCVEVASAGFLCKCKVGVQIALLFAECRGFVAWDIFSCFAIFFPLSCLGFVVFSGWDRGGGDHRVKASADVCGGDTECVWVWAWFDAVTEHILFVPCMVEWLKCVGLCDCREEKEDCE